MTLVDGVFCNEAHAFYDVTILAEDGAEITLHYVDYLEIEFDNGN